MASQKDLDNNYLKIAFIRSDLSRAIRKKVGAIIVEKTGKRIISDGFNGTPSGFDNRCEFEVNGELFTKEEVIHAESNAITKLVNSTEVAEGGTMYCTCLPCFKCSLLIIQSGIVRVVFIEMYHNKDSIDVLEKAGIRLEQAHLDGDGNLIDTIWVKRGSRIQEQLTLE